MVDRKTDIIAALELVGPGLIIACLVGPLAFDRLLGLNDLSFRKGIVSPYISDCYGWICSARCDCGVPFRVNGTLPVIWDT
ncbi:MAG: hypothetical protein ACYSWZ_02465 [Planctomycetota bacterium]